MGTFGGSSRRRVRWVAVFALLLFTSSAVPVLADSPERVSPPIPSGNSATTLPPAAETPTGIRLPGNQKMAETFKQFEQKEKEEAAALASPTAVQEREASQRTYANFSAAQAEQLLKTRFADVLAALNNDPARYLSGATLDRSLGDSTAEVTNEGKTALMEGPMPVQTKNAEGKLKKVDLSLEKTPNGYKPANPLVEVDIGNSAEEGVKMGKEHLAISQVGAGGSAARTFGGENVFYGEVEEGSATDLLVSPISTGVELFDLLRSIESPETLRFHVKLPEGAKLQPDGNGGADVVAGDGSTIAEVPAPRAVDAQGKTVPVSLEVNGDVIALKINHREEEVAYPILVDPEVIEPVFENWYAAWYNNQNLGALSAWYWNEPEGQWWIDHGYEDTSWPGHGGLFIATMPGSLPGGAVGPVGLFGAKLGHLPFKRLHLSLLA